MRTTVELAHFFAFGYHRACSCGSKERGDTGAARADTLRECTLRIQFELHFPAENHLFEQFILTYIRADVLFDLSRRQQLAQSPLVDACVVGNGSEVLDALAHQGCDQILGNAAKPETTHHEGGAILNVAYGLISAGNHFVHKQKILNRYGEEEQMKKSPPSETWSASLGLAFSGPDASG